MFLQKKLLFAIIVCCMGPSISLAQTCCIVHDTTGTNLNVRDDYGNLTGDTFSNGECVMPGKRDYDRYGRLWVLVKRWGYSGHPRDWVFGRYLVCNIPCGSGACR